MDKIKNHYEKYWSDKDNSFEMYERNYILDQFFQKEDKVLDVGCGDGVVADFLQKKCGAKVIGVDISEKAIKQAIQKGIDARQINAEEKLPFSNQTFDAVFWGDNVEHLFNPLETAKEIKRVLKTGGRLIISCPNMGYWRYRIYYFLNGKLPDTEWTGNPIWSWSHIRFFNLEVLKDFLKKAGFNKVNRVVGISSRRMDKPFLSYAPSLAGMILVMEVK